MPKALYLWKNVEYVRFVKKSNHVIDRDGYRPNVGIILSNDTGRVLWARRIGQDAWQFPQGGIRAHESPEEAMYRELHEEIGLYAANIEIIGHTRDWLRYRLPPRLIRHGCKPLCIGQKQIWYMLRLIGDESCVRLDLNEKPEFDCWRWVHYWYPLREIVPFKRQVYQRALSELAPLVNQQKNLRQRSMPQSNARQRIAGQRP